MGTRKNHARNTEKGPTPEAVPSPFTTPKPTPNEGADRMASAPPMDRRSGLDRREVNASAGAGASETDMDRRRGPGRRRSDFAKAAEEGEMTPEQFMFLMAIDSFKKSNDRMYPTWTDILEVIRLLGYRKTMPSELKVRNTEDWREAPDAPSNTRVVSGARKKAA
jgi:hypothetical protein